MKETPEVLLSNIHFIEQGIQLLETIDDDLYSQDNGPYNKSSIGRHFRHIIEHYFSLIEADFTGQINYDNRERNLRLENDREFMIHSLQNVIESLQIIEEKPELLVKRVQIICNEGFDSKNESASVSSIMRELQFLISHTVHHYALIGLILKTLGFEPSEDFGVAPSTLKHEKLKTSVERAS